jgi:hypothetical protein
LLFITDRRTTALCVLLYVPQLCAQLLAVAIVTHGSSLVSLEVELENNKHSSGSQFNALYKIKGQFSACPKSKTFY